MEQKEMILRLQEHGVIKLTTETRYGTFMSTHKSSLIAQQVSNRSSADWKKAQFVIINKTETDDNINYEQYIDGWKSLAEEGQFLIIYEKDQWHFYDCNGHGVSFDEMFLSRNTDAEKDKPNFRKLCRLSCYKWIFCKNLQSQCSIYNMRVCLIFFSAYLPLTP